MNAGTQVRGAVFDSPSPSAQTVQVGVGELSDASHAEQPKGHAACQLMSCSSDSLIHRSSHRVRLHRSRRRKMSISWHSRLAWSIPRHKRSQTPNRSHADNYNLESQLPKGNGICLADLVKPIQLYPNSVPFHSSHPHMRCSWKDTLHCELDEDRKQWEAHECRWAQNIH